MRYPIIITMLLVVLLATSCQPGPDLAGKYQAADPREEGGISMLVLNADGKGVWKLGHETVNLTWEGSKTGVWLHLKSGGVIPASIGSDGSISIDLQDAGIFHFQRADRGTP